MSVPIQVLILDCRVASVVGEADPSRFRPVSGIPVFIGFGVQCVQFKKSFGDLADVEQVVCGPSV